MVNRLSIWQFNLWLTVSTALLILVAVSLFITAGKSSTLGQLAEPGSTVRQSAASLQSAGAVSEQGLAHPDQRTITVDISEGDNFNFQLHLANVAAQNGWYAHRLGQQGMSLLIPEEQLTTVLDMEVDPYGWLEKHQSEHGVATEPELGNLPHLVRIHTVRVSPLRSGKIVAGVVVSIAAFLTGMIGLAAATAWAQEINKGRRKEKSTG